MYAQDEWKPIDTFKDYSVKMTAQFFSKNPTEIKAPISTSVEIPLTEKNKFIFGIDPDSPAKVPDLEYRITNGNRSFSEGVMRVDNFRWNGLNNKIGVQMEDRVSQIIKKLKKDNVSEFITDTENTTSYWHHFNLNGLGGNDMATLNAAKSKIIYPYQNTLGDGFESFIYTHRNNYEFDSRTSVQHLQPAYNVKSILDAMFAHVGVTWSSEAFSDNVYTADRGGHQYPMSELWMSLPCRWLAKTDDDWSSSLVMTETPAQRRTFNLDFYRTYSAPNLDMIFGEASLGSSGVPRFRWMPANEMRPYEPSGYSQSNFDAYTIVQAFVPRMENGTSPNKVFLTNRPARYRFNFSSFTVPSITIRSYNVNGSTNWNQWSQGNIADDTGGSGAPFYWQLVIMSGSQVKRFRVSPYLYASQATEGGKDVLKISSTTISTALIDNIEQYFDANEAEILQVFLLPVAAPEAKLTYGGQQWRGGEITANINPDAKLTYKYDTTFPQSAFFQLQMTPHDDYFPIIADEIPNVKYSIASAYPDMKMWDLMKIILQRFNLQLFYDVETGELMVDNVYRNGWKKNQDLAQEIPTYHLFDSGEPVEADVRVDSTRLIEVSNKVYLDASDLDASGDRAAASTIDYELDPDGDKDVKLQLSSGIYTGRVHGAIKTQFDDRTHEVAELLLAGAAFVQEASTDQYGIRFGFLGGSNIGDDYRRVSVMTPRSIRKEGSTLEWEGRASFASIGSLDALIIDYRKFYYDGTPELDYIISCGVESGAGSGSDHSAFGLFHQPLYDVIQKSPTIKCSFVMDITDLYDLKLGSVLDFGLGLFAVTSIGSIEVIEGRTRADVTGYIL